MQSFFNKPYPHNPLTKKESITSAFIGVFVAFFLAIFQPFGISHWETDHRFLKIIGFGVVSFICTLSVKAVLALVLKPSKAEERWNVWKEILALLITLLFIAFGNLIYADTIEVVSFGINELFRAILVTFLLGIFPITANIFIKYNRYLSLNQKEALQMEQEVIDYQQRLKVAVTESTQDRIVPIPKRLRLISENEKEVLEMEPDDLLYIESADNYSEVIFLKDGTITKQLIRTSLKRIESHINISSIIRCHRSYIVNLKQVAHIKGNAQGYKINFKSGTEHTIPVSRNYGKILLDGLKSLK